MTAVTAAVAEIRAARDTAETLAHGLCPVVAAQFAHPCRYNSATPGNDVTAFCTACPDRDCVPFDCPEVGRDAYDDKPRVCVLYRLGSSSSATPGGQCPRANLDGLYRCTCFMPKGAEWHAAHDAWVARRQRDRARDARIELGRRESARLRMGRVRMEVAENA